MSNIVGQPLIPTLYLTSVGHINYGQIGATKKVDQWHFDSTAFVAVIILSDIDGMIGSWSIKYTAVFVNLIKEENFN